MIQLYRILEFAKNVKVKIIYVTQGIIIWYLQPNAMQKNILISTDHVIKCQKSNILILWVKIQFRS